VIRRLAAVTLAGALLGACGSAGAPAPSSTTVAPGTTTTTPSGSGDRRQAPEFPDGLEWLNTDRPLSIAGLRGKVVLLDFWTYGCINCIHIIPDLERLEREYPDELVIIGVHSAKFTNEAETDNIRNVIARYGIDHPVVNDRDFAVWNQWGATGWPTLVLVDPAGGVVGGFSGEGIYPIFQPVIDSVVADFDARGLLDRTPLDLSPVRLPDTVLSFPGKVLADPAGGRLFVADTNHQRVVIADLLTGEVRDVAGSGLRGYAEGAFEAAAFDQPEGMALSDDGTILYVADLGNHAIRAVDLADRTVTTLVGTGEQAENYPPSAGVGPSVALSSPWDLVRVGDTLYVAMAGSHQIWRVEISTRVTEPFAGTGREGVTEGPRRAVDLAQPSGLAYDGAGRLYFADAESSTIRWVDLAAGGESGVLAGSGNGLFDFGDVDGTGTEARFQHPLGVAFMDGTLYVTDTYNSKVKAIDPTTGSVTTISGGVQGWADGGAPAYSEPGGLSSANGVLYVADTNNHVIRRVDPATGSADTIVLFGIERFPVASEDAGVTTVMAPPATVGTGPGTVTVDLTLPDGEVLNDIAPLSIEWDGSGVVDFGDAGSYGVVAPDLPITLPVTFHPGTGTVTADLTVYHCREGESGLCLIDRVRLVIPVTVTVGGPADLRVAYAVAGPVG
jgi:DNA-binding beta-propeller fold protein YncE